jgi:hypothetical protein
MTSLNGEETGRVAVVMMEKWSSVLNPSLVTPRCVEVLKFKSNVNIRDSVGIEAPIPKSGRDECERMQASVVGLSLEFSKVVLLASDPSMWPR